MNTTGCKTVAVVGLGLIGGSIAKAFQKYTPHRVLGLDRDTAVMREALDCGAIDEAITPAQLAQASLIYLCLYPRPPLILFGNTAVLSLPAALSQIPAASKRKFLPK